MSTPSPLRIVFMGTPEYAVPVLSALLDAGHEVVGVYTRPDREAGRGRRLTPTPVKEAALERGLAVFQPASLRRDEAARQELASLSPDLIVVAAYGLLLPPEVLYLPRLNTLNVHPSLLPRYRGPSPVASAILKGDETTGVTIMQLDEGMDTGPVVAQRETAIGPHETTEDLTWRLFRMGAELLVETIPAWEQGELEARPQDDSQATVTRRMSREDGEIDWGQKAVEIARRVRAFYPWPGTFTSWQGKTLKIVDAAPFEGDSPAASPGEVVALPGDGLGIGTGEGVLEVRRLQMEGRRAVTAREFVQGYRDFPGSQVGEKTS